MLDLFLPENTKNQCLLLWASFTENITRLITEVILVSDVTQHYINSFHFTNIYLQRRSDGDDFPSMLSDNIIHDAIFCVVLRKVRKNLLQTFYILKITCF